MKINKDEAEVVIKETIDYANNEINKTKKKFQRILFSIFVVLAFAILLIVIKPVSYRYVESDLFTKSDITSAMDVVKDDFKSLKGCKLFSLSYNGDTKTLREKVYQLSQGPKYDEYIVVDSVFLSPLISTGVWNNGEIYTWDWILGRNTGERWNVIGKGY